MEPPSKRREKPKRMCMDAVREDMEMVGLTLEDAKDRMRWHFILYFKVIYGLSSHNHPLATHDQTNKAYLSS